MNPKPCIFALLVAALAFCGRDGACGQEKPPDHVISLQLRAQYWRYAAELQQAQAILRDARDNMATVLKKIHEACNGDLQMGGDGEPECKPVVDNPPDAGKP